MRKRHVIVVCVILLAISIFSVLLLLWNSRSSERRDVVAKSRPARIGTEEGSRAHLRSEIKEELLAASQAPPVDPQLPGVEEANAMVDIPVDIFHQRRLDTIRLENLADVIQNIGNIDDWALALSSMSDGSDSSPRAQTVMVTRILRVRRILEESNQHRDYIAAGLRELLHEANSNWPEAHDQQRAIWKEFFDNEEHTMDALRSAAEVSAPAHRYRFGSIAAVYVLSEIGDTEALPLIAETYRLHIAPDGSGDPRRNSSVAPAISLYAMHKLIEGFPQSKLNPSASAIRNDYLRMALPLYPPKSGIYGTEWDSPRHESDPYLNIVDPERKSLTSQPRVKLEVYPVHFTDGTMISTEGGIVSPQADQLFDKISVFIDVVF